MSLLEDVVATRELLLDPAHWAKGVFARNAEGESVGPKDGTAVAWCVRGAFIKAAGVNSYKLNMVMYDAQAIPAQFGEGRLISVFNDDEDTTHPMIIAALDKTIEYIKAIGEPA